MTLATKRTDHSFYKYLNALTCTWNGVDKQPADNIKSFHALIYKGQTNLFTIKMIGTYREALG